MIVVLFNCQYQFSDYFQVWCSSNFSVGGKHLYKLVYESRALDNFENAMGSHNNLGSQKNSLRSTNLFVSKFLRNLKTYSCGYSKTTQIKKIYTQTNKQTFLPKTNPVQSV